MTKTTTTEYCGAICADETNGMMCLLPKGHPGIIHKDMAGRTWGMTREERGEPPHPLVAAAQRDDGTDLSGVFMNMMVESIADSFDSGDSSFDGGSSHSDSFDGGGDYSGGGGESGGGGSSGDW